MRLLAIGAHPDDIEAGCGGTLIKYAENGHRVFLMVMTEGELGASRGIRRREQRLAAKALCTEQLYWGGYRDTQLPTGRSLIQKLERIVKTVQPHFIFVHYFDDTHQDHRNLAQSATSATRYVANFLFYEVPSTQNFTPTCYSDIASVLHRKLALLEAHVLGYPQVALNIAFMLVLLSVIFAVVVALDQALGRSARNPPVL